MLSYVQCADDDTSACQGMEDVCVCVDVCEREREKKIMHV